MTDQLEKTISTEFVDGVSALSEKFLDDLLTIIRIELEKNDNPDLIDMVAIYSLALAKFVGPIIAVAPFGYKESSLKDRHAIADFLRKTYMGALNTQSFIDEISKAVEELHKAMNNCRAQSPYFSAGIKPDENNS